MMKKILVTGSRGFLGARLVDYLSGRGYDVVALSHRDLDITDASAVMEKISEIMPSAVFHCAAISDTGYAQQHPDESMAINVEGSANVARACAQTGAKLVYMSSDHVYGGAVVGDRLVETIELSPKNVYGQHKVLSERRVQEILPSAVGLRLTWMYDFPSRSEGYKVNKNIVVNLLGAAASGVPLKGCTRELRAVTYVWDVVANLEKAMSIPGGIYNFGCSNEIDSYSTYVQLAAILGLPDGTVVPDDTWTRNIAIDTAKAQAAGIFFSDTIDSFRKALKSSALNRTASNGHPTKLCPLTGWGF